MPVVTETLKIRSIAMHQESDFDGYFAFSKFIKFKVTHQLLQVSANLPCFLKSRKNQERGE